VYILIYSCSTLLVALITNKMKSIIEFQGLRCIGLTRIQIQHRTRPSLNHFSALAILADFETTQKMLVVMTWHLDS
jgi:hypothetical protein